MLKYGGRAYCFDRRTNEASLNSSVLPLFSMIVRPAPDKGRLYTTLQDTLPLVENEIRSAWLRPAGREAVD